MIERQLSLSSHPCWIHRERLRGWRFGVRRRSGRVSRRFSNLELPHTMTSSRTSGQTWLILFGAALLLTLGMGLRQSLGLFLTPVTRDLAVTATEFTLSVAIQNIVWGVSQAPVGVIADRFGLRVTMMAGAVIYVVGLGIMAAAGGAVALFVSGAFIGVALSCTASSLALTAVARAVSEERRSTILGVVAAAGSLGTLLVPLGTQGFLAAYAWQIGALFFAALAAAMLPRSEEHTSELQSRLHLVCRLLLEKKKNKRKHAHLNEKKKKMKSEV